MYTHTFSRTAPSLPPSSLFFFVVVPSPMLEMVRSRADPASILSMGRTHLGSYAKVGNEEGQLARACFSLLAYRDPLTSPAAHLLDTSRRQGLSAALNEAMLGFPMGSELSKECARLAAGVAMLQRVKSPGANFARDAVESMFEKRKGEGKSAAAGDASAAGGHGVVKMGE